jgi:hypothetical protein
MTRNKTKEKTVITRHRSPSYGRAYLADGGSSAELRYSVETKTRDHFRPIRSLAHCSNIVTQRCHKRATASHSTKQASSHGYKPLFSHKEDEDRCSEAANDQQLTEICVRSVVPA